MVYLNIFLDMVTINSEIVVNKHTEDIHKILKDPECRGNLWCFTFAILSTMLLIGSLVYGIAFLSQTEYNSNINYDLKSQNDNLEILRSSIMPSCFKGEKTYRSHR